MEPWVTVSGGEQVLERSKAIGQALWRLISLSMYRLAQLSISDFHLPTAPAQQGCG